MLWAGASTTKGDAPRWLGGGYIAVEVNDRGAVQLDRRPLAAIRVVEEARLDPRRGNGTRIEHQILEAVPYHRPTSILPEIA